MFTPITLTLNNSSTARCTSSLVGHLVDLEGIRIVPRRTMHALLGHQRSKDDLVRHQVQLAFGSRLVHRRQWLCRHGLQSLNRASNISFLVGRLRLLFDLVESRASQQQLRRPQHDPGIQFRDRHHADIRNVASRFVHIHVVTRRGHKQRSIRVTERPTNAAMSRVFGASNFNSSITVTC